ncbi:MAG: site-specific DNA-methyltransferase [Promethearchaeota archaeon]
MVELKWKGKLEIEDIISKPYETKPFHVLDIYPSIGMDSKPDEKWQNLLIWGDNKTVMKSLITKFKSKISLIYIDPPFGTGGNFNLKVQIGENGNFIDEIAYNDKWNEGLNSYLDFMRERLILMKLLLADSGVIFIHLDWHISHYIKVIMDEIFGYENFRNEIIWAYPAASVKTRRFFIRSYDTILFYSKTDDYVFRDDPRIYQEFSDRVKNALKKDDKGVFYYRGGSHNGKKLSRKVYVETEGIFPRDVWSDIPYIRANTSEYQGFSTQKPERLLKRIILASTNSNDLVADFFCGSGTTLTVAEKLGRRWIGCDSNKHAIHIVRKRILNLDKSNDIIDWKKKYNKTPQSFKILGIEKMDKLDTISYNLLKKEVQDQKGYKINESPNLHVKIHKQNNRINVELIDYQLPFIDLISEKVKGDIKSFSDWIDYWAVDYYPQNNIFKAKWFSFRTPKDRKLALKSKYYHYDKPGNYNILIKVIDIFGIETVISSELKLV